MFEDIDEDLLRVLRDPRLWMEPPDFPGLREFVAQTFAEVDAEHAAAAALCASVLTGPSSRWPERMRTTPGTKTIYMVLQLLRRMPALIERRPADALQVTSLAVAIAEALDPREHRRPDHVVMARGQALRDHAYVLSFLGRHREALRYAEEAERAFSQVPGEDFDLARLALVKALALRLQDRSEEAIVLARQAAGTFRSLGEDARYVNARIIEAVMLYDGGAVERALEVWTGLRDVPGVDELAALRVAHNIGVCLCDLGRHEEAVAPLERCVAGFARAGLPTEQTRSRWRLGIALLGTPGRYAEGVALLRAVWQEFTDLDLPVDAALSALDLAEALVTNGETSEVPSICRTAIAQLTDAGLTMQAIPALALLREAAALGGVTRELLRDAHAKVEKVRRRDSLPPRPAASV